MKRRYGYIFIILVGLIFPFFVDAKEKVSITSVESRENGGVYEQFETPTFEDLTINFKGWFANVGESVHYKIVFKNDDNKDYQFADFKEEDGQFPSIDYSKSEYISYSLYCETGYTISANSTKECNMAISYIKEIPTELLTQVGGFTESNNITVKLDNGEKVVGNPKTGFTMSFIVIIVSGLVATSIILVSLKKKKLNALVLLLALGIVPLSVYAASLISININSEISISYGAGTTGTNPSFCYFEAGNYSLHEYEDGMTWMQYMSSDYNTEEFFVFPQNPTVPWGSASGGKFINYMGPPQNYGSTVPNAGSFAYYIETENDLIKDSTQGCYGYSN